jgi:hypothetical protein
LIKDLTDGRHALIVAYLDIVQQCLCLFKEMRHRAIIKNLIETFLTTQANNVASSSLKTYVIDVGYSRVCDLEQQIPGVWESSELPDEARLVLFHVLFTRWAEASAFDTFVLSTHGPKVHDVNDDPFEFSLGTLGGING